MILFNSMSVYHQKRRINSDYTLSLFVPRKDQCAVCARKSKIRDTDKMRAYEEHFRQKELCGSRDLGHRPPPQIQSDLMSFVNELAPPYSSHIVTVNQLMHFPTVLNFTSAESLLCRRFHVNEWGWGCLIIVAHRQCFCNELKLKLQTPKTSKF